MKWFKITTNDILIVRVFFCVCLMANHFSIYKSFCCTSQLKDYLIIYFLYSYSLLMASSLKHWNLHNEFVIQNKQIEKWCQESNISDLFLKIKFSCYSHKKDLERGFLQFNNQLDFGIRTGQGINSIPLCFHLTSLLKTTQQQKKLKITIYFCNKRINKTRWLIIIFFVYYFGTCKSATKIFWSTAYGTRSQLTNWFYFISVVWTLLM